MLLFNSGKREYELDNPLIISIVTGIKFNKPILANVIVCMVNKKISLLQNIIFHGPMNTLRVARAAVKDQVASIHVSRFSNFHFTKMESFEAILAKLFYMSIVYLIQL